MDKTEETPAMDYALVRKHCAKVAKQLFDDFDRRKSILLDVAREFYPLGVPGLVRQVDNLKDAGLYDEDHRLLTTFPVMCLQKGASGFHGNLTSPARRWFRFQLPSFAMKDGKTTHAQRQSLSNLTKAVEWTFSRSGIYKTLRKAYEHLLAFGFACIILKPDKKRIVQGEILRVGTYALGTDERGQVDRVVRRLPYTASQLLAVFGKEALTPQILEAAQKGIHNRVYTVLNLIEPNATTKEDKAYDPVAQTIGLDDDQVYRSIYILEGANDNQPRCGVLMVSGFHIRPIVAPRLDAEAGDTYGMSPGIQGLDAARGAQTFKFDLLRASGNRVQPAVIASAEFKDEGLKLGRGQINYTRFGEQKGGMVAPIFPNPPDSSGTREDFEEAKKELADLFFNSAFAVIDALKNNPGVKTATEVDALIRENMEQLGPVVSNLDVELLDPLVEIMADYTIKANIAPLSEDDLKLMENIQVEYVSQIHLAQKQTAIGAAGALLEFMGKVAQANPEALDKLDADHAIDEYAEMIGAPEEFIAADDKIKTVRDQRAKAAEAQQRFTAMQAMGKAGRDLGSIPTDEDHVGGRIVQGLGGE